MDKFRVGDIVRIKQLGNDFHMVPNLKVGFELEITDIHFLKNHYLIATLDTRYAFWYVHEDCLELAEQIPYGNIIRKIAEIKVRRNSLGYKY